MNIHNIIKQRRIELGLTLNDVAKALGVAESTISRYETSDIENMGIDKIESLAKVLQCSPEYLMGWDNKPNTTIDIEKLNPSNKKRLVEYYELLLNTQK